MYSPSASSAGSRSSQGGNPNLGFVLGALLLLLVGLVVYIFNRPTQEYTLLKQLPPEPVASSADRRSGTGASTTPINPNGDKLLDDVLSKPAEPSAEKAEEKKRREEERKRKEQEQAKDAPKASPEPVAPQPKADSAAKPAGASVTSQFAVGGSTEYSYTVKPGETLFRLASRFRNPATQIKYNNQLPDENVQVGQAIKLRIQGIHKVGAGEGLNAIARTYGISVNDIRRANDLAGDQIRLGQELVIPVK